MGGFLQEMKYETDRNSEYPAKKFSVYSHTHDKFLGKILDLRTIIL